MATDRIYTMWRIERFFFDHHLKIITVLIRSIIRIVFSADIPYKTFIGEGTVFPHDALGCVIHPSVVIGKNCKILHNTTFGGRGGHHGVPVVGNNVLIGTGSILAGGIKVGDNAIIGAGSVVIHDVESNTVVAGNPARVIKKKGDND